MIGENILLEYDRRKGDKIEWNDPHSPAALSLISLLTLLPHANPLHELWWSSLTP